MAHRPTILWTLSSPPPKLAGTDLEFEHVPFVRIELHPEAVDPQRLAECHSAVFTSRWAVAAMEAHRSTLTPLPMIAIGSGTRQALEALGGQHIALPAVATGKGLVAQLTQQPPPAPVFFPHGTLGGEQVLTHFAATNTGHYSPVVYQTIERPLDDIRTALAGGERLSAVALGSPSAVAVWQRLNLDLLIATIGPTTSQACRQAGLKVWREAQAGDPVDLARQFTGQFEGSLDRV